MTKFKSMNSSKKQKYERKSILINPGFQYRIIGYMILFTLILLGLFMLAFDHFEKELLVQASFLNLKEHPLFFDFLTKQIHSLQAMIGLLCIASVLYFGLGGLIVSHRLAGPIYQIKKNLLEFKKNQKFKRIVLRDKDYFKDLADVINDVFDSR